MYPIWTSLCFNQYDWDYTSNICPVKISFSRMTSHPSQALNLVGEAFISFSLHADTPSDRVGHQNADNKEEADLVNTITTVTKQSCDDSFVNVHKSDYKVDSFLKSLTPLSTNVVKGYILTWAGKGNFARGEIPFWAYHKVVVVLPYGQYPVTQKDASLAFTLAFNLHRRILYKMYARYRCQKHYRVSIEIEAAKVHLAIEAKKLLQEDAFAGFIHVSFGDRHLMSQVASTAYKPKISCGQRNKIARKIDCEVGGSRTCWADWKPAGTWSASCRDFR